MSQSDNCPYVSWLKGNILKIPKTIDNEKLDRCQNHSPSFDLKKITSRKGIENDLNLNIVMRIMHAIYIGT